MPVLAALCAACGAARADHAPPFPALPPPAPGAYRVQVGDELAIRLYLAPELNEDVLVRPDGRITTELASAVPAAGRTPEEVQAALLPAYQAELKAPRLSVEVKTYAPIRVYVTGEVPAPGEIDTQTGAPPTLLQAIARAGGLRVTGDARAVLVVRRGAGNRPEVYRARYAEAAGGQDPAADVALQNDDVVVVPRTGIAELYVWVNQHIQQFVPVSWGFSYNVTPIATTKR